MYSIYILNNLVFFFSFFCLYPPWLRLPCPHEYQDIIECWCHQIKTFCILYFRCFVFPWPALACPHEYQEIMEIRCHQIEIGRKCAQHFHSLPFFLGFLLWKWYNGRESKLDDPTKLFKCKNICYNVLIKIVFWPTIYILISNNPLVQFGRILACL